MDMALYFSLVGFVVAMSITPGPNNLMMMSSSALFGVRATLPHYLGVQLGFSLMAIAAVFGLGELVQRLPQALILVKAGGAVWLLWMSWQFVRAGLAQSGDVARKDEEARRESRPFRLHEAALFQWINPKAMLMTISASGAYIALAESPGERAIILVGTFILFGAPCGLLWILAGGAIHRFMNDVRWSRLLNLAIALMLVATIAIIVVD